MSDMNDYVDHEYADKGEYWTETAKQNRLDDAKLADYRWRQAQRQAPIDLSAMSQSPKHRRANPQVWPTRRAERITRNAARAEAQDTSAAMGAWIVFMSLCMGAAFDECIRGFITVWQILHH